MSKIENRGELSYFGATLTAFLQESHPTMSNDDEFIQARSDAATDAYIDATLMGANHFAALEQANAVLYCDLRFSKFDTVRHIVEDWFPEIEEENVVTFSPKIVQESRQIFETYDLSDDFESGPAYNDLVLELTGFIQKYIEFYGI